MIAQNAHRDFDTARGGRNKKNNRCIASWLATGHPPTDGEPWTLQKSWQFLCTAWYMCAFHWGRMMSGLCCTPGTERGMNQPLQPQPTYLPTYLRAHLPTNLHTNLPPSPIPSNAVTILDRVLSQWWKKEKSLESKLSAGANVQNINLGATFKTRILLRVSNTPMKMTEYH